MVRSDRASKADVVEGFHNFKHTERPVVVLVGGLVENPRRFDLDVAHMPEMHTSHLAEVADSVRYVVVLVGAKGPAAQGQAVAGTVHQFDEPFQVGLRSNYPGQTKHRPGRIVGMNGHFDAALFGGRDNAVKEILQVRKQLLVVNSLVQFKQPFQFCFPRKFALPVLEILGILARQST